MGKQEQPLEVPLQAGPGAKPVVKWAGGKGQLLKELHSRMPRSFRRYFEPFAGGAALFFSISSQLDKGQAFLNDRNPELINLYRVIQKQVDELIVALRVHQQHYEKNPKEYFYQVRACQPVRLTPLERASRLVFLNKTCFNGLYRVNRSGQFNVPFGRYQKPAIVNEEGLRTASQALHKATLTEMDFAEAVAEAKAGDFIYLDPPYQPVSATANFTSYTDGAFHESEQKRLARLFKELNQRGCHVLLSNSDSPMVHECYRDFHIHTVKANRAINSNAQRRKGVTEVMVCNYTV